MDSSASSLRSGQEPLEHIVSPINPAIAPPLSPRHHGSLVMIDGPFEVSSAGKQVHLRTGKESTKVGRPRVTIDVLPDVPLLEILDFYVTDAWTEWCTLVHVCQKWRNLVFGSPRRLNLRLLCESGTPVREMLHIWPPLPIVVLVHDFSRGADDICAALEHNDRIGQLSIIRIPSSQSEKVLAALYQPFPSLTYVKLAFVDETTPVDPDLFLGGSAPDLLSLSLFCTPLSRFPKLLFSATCLFRFELHGIPHSGYISPQAMIACLSVLTGIESLTIEFDSPRSRPGRNRRHPSQTSTLPILTEWKFKGAVEYLEDFVARISTPLLHKLEIIVFHQPIFETPRLAHFISCIPRFREHEEAYVVFSDWGVKITLDGVLEFNIPCREPAQKLLTLTQICASFFPQALLPTVGVLYVFPEDEGSQLHWPVDIESDQWLELFRPFTAVEYLRLSPEFLPHIAPVLRELVGERVTEVLPALRALYLEETLPSESPVPESIGQFKFVYARRHSSRPITVSCWEREAHL